LKEDYFILKLEPHIAVEQQQLNRSTNSNFLILNATA